MRKLLCWLGLHLGEIDRKYLEKSIGKGHLKVRYKCRCGVITTEE